MKLNIQKLQSGGGFGQLFSAVANPFTATNQQAEASSKKENSGIVSQAVLDQLGKNGLPNEVQQFELKLASLQRKIDSGVRVSSTELALLRSEANRIIKQSQYLDKSIEYAQKNESLGDIAIDQNGYIFALDAEGKVKKVEFKKYDTNNFQALTYGELAELRRNSPELVNNYDIIQTIGSSIGVQKINDFIQNILSKVGESQNKQEAYETLGALLGKANVKQMSQQEYNAIVGLSQVYDKMGADAVFKTVTSQKGSNTNMALQYIMSILPKNMRAQLQGQFIAQGGSYKESTAYPSYVIQSAVQMASNYSSSYGIDYQSTINSDKAESTKGKSFYSTPFEQFADGNLNAHDAIPISDPLSKNKMGMTLTGQTYSGFFNQYGQLVQQNATLADALKWKLGTILDMNHAYLGKQELNDINDLNNIVISGNKTIAAVDMPVDASGEIDWSGFDGFQKAEEEIKVRNFRTTEEKNKCHEKWHSYARYDSTGKLVPLNGRTERYFYVSGYAYSGMLDDNNTLIRPLSGTDEDNAEAIVKGVYNGQPKSSGFSEPRGNGWFKDLCEVPIFIKIDKNAASNARLNVGHGPIEDASTREDFMREQQLQEADQLVTNSNILYQ